MKAKYMGAMPVSTAYTFELSDEQREIQIRIDVAPNQTIQMNPLLAALSLVYSYDGDVDKVRISLKDTEFPDTGLRVLDVTEDQEPLEVEALWVTKEGLSLELLDEEEERRSYPMATEAFYSDVMAFISQHDPNYIFPFPESLDVVTQSYVDQHGCFWDTKEDVLRQHTYEQRAGSDCIGWLEDATADTFVYIEYLHLDSGEELAVANAYLHAYAWRDTEDDNLVHLSGVIDEEVDDMYMNLTLTRSSY